MRRPTLPRPRHLTMLGTIGAGIGLWGLWIGLRPLSDNSLMTHLATGRLILDEGIPRSDPFTFTAAGTEWVVQSWLATVAYAVVDRWWGGDGLLWLNAALTTALALLVFRLTRPAGGVTVRLAVAALAVGVGAAAWSERPLLIGLILLALVLVVVHEQRDPRWLVPVFWLWVNVHGSFPLGLVLLGAVAVGSVLDGDRLERSSKPLLWGAAGAILGVVSPLGLTLLTFPVELVSRQEVLRNIVEWQAPRFTDLDQRIYLLMVVIAVIGVVRRPSYRHAVPAAVFVAASLVAARNVGVASIVLVPVVATAFTGIGTISGDERKPVFTAATLVVVLLGGLVTMAAFRDPAFSFDAYPTRHLAWLADNGSFGEDARVATPDIVGNYLEALEGPRRIVFIDDRYDMFPDDLVEDYLVLLRASARWEEVLDRHDIEAVVWQQSEPLASVLREADGWRIAFADGEWLVALRRPGGAPSQSA